MKKNLFFTCLLLLVLAALVGACSTMSTSTVLLEQARTDFTAMENNAAVALYAPLELEEARTAMQQANLASSHDNRVEDIDNLAYLARAKIALAQEVTKQKMAESDIARITRERDRLVLNQRSSEADKAKRDAQNLQRKSQEALARAEKLESEMRDLAAKKTNRGMVITIGEMLFGFDKAQLSKSGLEKVKKFAQVLKEYPERVAQVEGFTDSIGSASYNQKLSERRAEAVRDALHQMGVALDRVRVRGYGKQFPVAPNDTSENRHLNRRVEIILSDEHGNIMQREESK